MAMTFWKFPTKTLLQIRKVKAAALIDYCELPWEEACLHFYNSEKIVRTASATQVRKKIYTQAINRWKRYENQLSPLINTLGDLGVRLNSRRLPGLQSVLEYPAVWSGNG